MAAGVPSQLASYLTLLIPSVASHIDKTYHSPPPRLRDKTPDILDSIEEEEGRGEGGRVEYWRISVVNMKEKKKETPVPGSRKGRDAPTLESTQVRAGPCQDCGQLGLGIWKGRTLL